MNEVEQNARCPSGGASLTQVENQLAPDSTLNPASNHLVCNEAKLYSCLKFNRELAASCP